MLYVVVISACSAGHQEGASRPAGRTPASQYMYGGVNRLTGSPGRGPGDRARKRASVPAPSREASVGIATGGAVPPRDLDGRGTVRSIRRIEEGKKYGASRDWVPRQFTNARCRGASRRRRKQRNEKGNSKRRSEPTSVPVKVEVSESKEGEAHASEITEGGRNHPFNMTGSPYRSGVVRLFKHGPHRITV